MSRAESLFYANGCDYVAAQEDLIRKYKAGEMDERVYAETMSDLNSMFMDAQDALEKLAELNESIGSVDMQSFDDWETVFLNEVLV